jgi:hypothetical protein
MSGTCALQVSPRGPAALPRLPYPLVQPVDRLSLPPRTDRSSLPLVRYCSPLMARQPSPLVARLSSPPMVVSKRFVTSAVNASSYSPLSLFSPPLSPAPPHLLAPCFPSANTPASGERQRCSLLLPVVSRVLSIDEPSPVLHRSIAGRRSGFIDLDRGTDGDDLGWSHRRRRLSVPMVGPLGLPSTILDGRNTCRGVRCYRTRNIRHCLPARYRVLAGTACPVELVPTWRRVRRFVSGRRG